MRTLAAFALPALVSTTAAANTINGDPARSLVYALHYAGVPATTTKSTLTFKLAAIDCVDMVGGAGNLDDFQCAFGTSSIKDAAAYLLYWALESAEVEVVIYPSKFHVRAKALTCAFDSSKTGDDQYVCAADAIRLTRAVNTKPNPGTSGTPSNR